MDALVPLKPRNSSGKLSNAEDLGIVIRKRRKHLGLTQVELADACNCSPRFIGELERGVAGGNIKQVIRVCMTLGIDLFAKVRGEQHGNPRLQGSRGPSRLHRKNRL